MIVIVNNYPRLEFSLLTIRTATSEYLEMAKALTTSVDSVSTFEAVVGCLNCLLLLGVAYVLLDRHLQNRQLRAAAQVDANAPNA